MLAIILLLLGVAFTVFGYLIYFRKKYDLINGFKADYIAGRKTEAYAQKVGLIEFIIGIISILFGICVTIF